MSVREPHHLLHHTFVFSLCIYNFYFNLEAFEKKNVLGL